MKKSELKAIIQEVKQEMEKHIDPNWSNDPLLIAESFKHTDVTAMIYVDDYPYYLKKEGDSTHFTMHNNDKHLDNPHLSSGNHIGQYRGEPYYEDVRSWLKDSLKSKDLNGRKYTN